MIMRKYDDYMNNVEIKCSSLILSYALCKICRKKTHTNNNNDNKNKIK